MILEFEKYRTDLEALRAKLHDVGDGLHIDHMQQELTELHEEQGEPGFWDNLERSTHVTRKISQLEAKIKHYEGLVSQCDDIEVMMELAEEADDASVVPEVSEMLEKLRSDTDALELETLMRGQYDDHDAVLSLHAGAGGTEAQDWTSMLYRMYTRYCERMGFTVKLLDILEGDEAGLKSVTFEVSGDHAYGYLRGEKGVHRLVRISPFDANARRQTSFASLEVMPELDNNIKIEINPADIEMQVYRSSGAGGQHINKTSSAVRLIHKPTGIVTACQTQRSQLQNREYAMEMMKAKLYQIALQQHKEKIDDIKGVQNEIAWGHQIRSYVFMPYTLVKDHRTNFENGNVQAVMDGDLDGFIYAYLKASSRGELEEV